MQRFENARPGTPAERICPRKMFTSTRKMKKKNRKPTRNVSEICYRPLLPLKNFRSGKLQNESFPNFSIFRPEFCPEFCSEFSPNFSRTFRASFRGRRRPEKIHQKSPPFFNAKFPGKHEKKKIHKILLESRQSKIRRSAQHFSKTVSLPKTCTSILSHCEDLQRWLRY